MKRFLLTVALLVAAPPAYSFDWNSRSSFDREVMRQTARLEAGRRSGALTASEVSASKARHARVLAMVQRARADGRVTRSERVTYSSMLSRESRQINKNKYN